MIESKRSVLFPLKHLTSASDSSSAGEEQLSPQSKCTFCLRYELCMLYRKLIW